MDNPSDQSISWNRTINSTEGNVRISSISQAFTDPSVNPILPARQATIFGSTINMANTVLGAGLLGLPYAFANAGWLFGIVFLLVGFVASYYSCHLLALCSAKAVQPASFYTVARAVDPKVTDLIDFTVFLGGFGTCIAYLIVIGDLMPTAMEQMGASNLWQNRERWVMIGFILSAPLSLFHNLDYLKHTSLACGLFMLAFTGVVLLYAVDPSMDPCDGQQLDDDDKPCIGSETVISGLEAIGVIKVFSIVVFAYGCQANVFPIVNELERPTMPKVDRVFFLSIAFSAVLYSIVGSCGYLTYGDSVQPNLLKSYPATVLLSVMRIMISLVVAFSYPLQINPARRCFLTIMQNWIDNGAQASVVTIRIRYIMVTAILNFFSLLVALLVKDLGVILSLVGATGSVLLTFILPGWFYLHLYPLEGYSKFSSDSTSPMIFPEKGVANNNSDRTISVHNDDKVAMEKGFSYDDNERLLSSLALVDTLLSVHFDESTVEAINAPPADWTTRIIARVFLIAGIIIMPVAIITIFI